ncbi:MAG TPA: helix-turn-helix transcriptional regulator [Candidatus Saccharimonadales bacterium]|nr:helix-turn-helix transcriptional regulator [Candidatus Saccharimonadales bacterium]
MLKQQPTSAPPEFIRLLEQAIRSSGLTKAEVAFKADISPAYLSRLLHGERGVPADTIVSRLEDVLDVQPRGQLFDAAGRHDAVVSKVLKKPNARVLMRSLGPLTDDEMAIVLSVAAGFAKNHSTI